ncbi:MAG: hypothetical protein SHS37scaffold145_72 [Phage 71_18]|nr:MAG: hypothetical protein SHS37scaffold145_72 [Phage 71_18]
MPKGEPTKVVRLPVWLCEELEKRAEAVRPPVSLPTYITQQLAVPRSYRAVPALAKRCQCKVPTLSKAVSNLCTTCRRLR